MGDKSKTTERIVPVGVWKVPQNPFVKINFETGFCKEDNRSCFGIIIRNDIGAQMSFLNVEVEGDCLSVIRNLKENKKEQSVIGAYIHNIRESCVIFQKSVFHHVQKHINGATHALATRGLKRNEVTYLVGDVPTYALDAVEVDRR
ncbi:hypothetical protein Goarm_016983 [Gossypium armourianum]|uniref:RNase H type-1 domain-containing protein n=1 Tax=Gossypium armourianum TaxID=34283 RepID=A0A7J9JDZ2_9ROSI|nr:hypothetical protein [Gossypium armourianum]